MLMMVVMLLIPACTTTTVIRVPTCDGFKIINPSREDTELTLKQVADHNEYLRFCRALTETQVDKAQ